MYRPSISFSNQTKHYITTFSASNFQNLRSGKRGTKSVLLCYVVFYYLDNPLQYLGHCLNNVIELYLIRYIHFQSLKKHANNPFDKNYPRFIWYPWRKLKKIIRDIDKIKACWQKPGAERYSLTWIVGASSDKFPTNVSDVTISFILWVSAVSGLSMFTAQPHPPTLGRDLGQGKQKTQTLIKYQNLFCKAIYAVACCGVLESSDLCENLLSWTQNHWHIRMSCIVFIYPRKCDLVTIVLCLQNIFLGLVII